MAGTNEARKLSFSNSWVVSTLIESAQDFSIDDAIVVNLSTTPASYQAGGFCGIIQPFQSKQLRRCTIIAAERLAVFTLRTTENLGGLALAWDWFGDRYSSFNRETPLYVSTQEEVAELHFNPAELFSFDGSSECAGVQRYQLKLNLWYAPALTDCSIHCEHSFLEVHTQIVGIGHMQKFRTGDPATIFEDLVVPPGVTHETFFQFTPERGFHYPMHRYFSQTECVWMAIEFHPC
jgi:hypothetical protein